MSGRSRLSRDGQHRLRAEVEAERTRRAKRARDDIPTLKVVFWGAASFRPAIRGHTAVPRKAIVKLLAARGVVVATGEYGTSKNCVCGKELTNKAKAPPAAGPRTVGTTRAPAKAVRCRAHKESIGPCVFLQVFEDRDVLAAVNILMCGIHALWGWPRPVHLRPPPRGD